MHSFSVMLTNTYVKHQNKEILGQHIEKLIVSLFARNVILHCTGTLNKAICEHNNNITTTNPFLGLRNFVTRRKKHFKSGLFQR